MPIPQVQHLLKYLAMAQSRFLYGMGRVPDERLDWSPDEAAATPLQLAGKTAALAEFLAHLLQNRSMPNRQSGLPPPPRNRQEAQAGVGAAFARLHAVIRELSEEDLQQTTPAPWGPSVPIALTLCFIPSVIGYCQGQLNYIQVAYGDTDPNVPPGWGQEEG